MLIVDFFFPVSQLNPSHPRSSALLNANDPVTMYMLAETAIGDSRDYEVLSLEEMEELKKEYTFLSGRIDGARRKLALEMKLRDAAKSLSKLYNPKSSRTSEEYDPNSSPKSRRSRHSLFGRRGSETHDKSDEELAASTRKCEALAQDLWKLENRAQEVHRRLLEHTAGVLQMTHKGLKKNVKNGVPQSPESMNGNHTRDSIEDFDDRSLYQSSNYLDGYNGYGNDADHANGSGPMSVGLDAIQNTERKLESLSTQMRNAVMRSNPDYYLDPVPQAASNGGPVNPTATVEAHLAYIANGLGILGTLPAGASRAADMGDDSEHSVSEINARMYKIVADSGISRGPTLAPPPAIGSGLQEHVSYLTTGIDSLQHRFDGLLEQKGILTTQIQQQRELNSKSDAERDAHIGDLVEQLARARKEYELSEREGQATRDELDLVNQQLEAAREEASHHQQRSLSRDDDESGALAPEREARERAEAEVSRLTTALQHLQSGDGRHKEAREVNERAESEIARLQGVIENLHREADEKAEEVTEARHRAEQQVAQMEEAMQQIRNESDNRIREATISQEQAQSEVALLEAMVAQSNNEVDPQVREATEARGIAEQRVLELEGALQQIRNETDERIREHTDSHAHAQSEVARLQAIIEQSSSDVDPARTEAEANAARLQEEFTELESEYVRAQTELTMAKAELDSAQGTRSQRAAANPAFQKEFEELNTRNIELATELAGLKAGRPGDSNAQRRVETLERELRETVDDYEAMTKASIEFEKEREGFEGVIDQLRDRCEQLETQLNEERISWMGLNSPTSGGRDSTSETTSTMVLKNEFKRMMRDTRIENMKILKVRLPFNALPAIHHIICQPMPANSF